MNKRIPVVGDLITTKYWDDEWYEVTKVTENKLWVKVQNYSDVDYRINGYEWLFKSSPIEEAIHLLTEVGYTVDGNGVISPPKPKRTGTVTIWTNPEGGLYSANQPIEKTREWINPTFEPTAIVHWTEGDGMEPPTA